MLLVGLTGGIGSGKSTVAAMLADRGAEIVDADRISREVVAPGGAAFDGVVERFGSKILTAKGTIDRAVLADIVFRDASARRDLEAITHPAIGRVMAERMAEHAQTDRVVVLDIPLLKEKSRMGVQKVIVVDCPEEVALERLVTQRGFAEEDARRRMAAQLSREERRSLADFVVDNSSGRERLTAEIDHLWEWLSQRRA